MLRQNDTLAVPHLAIALHGPLNALEEKILKQQAKIEAWFRDQFRKTPAPLMASVDLRNSGYKIAPVDTNLFPAGFNNLNPELMPLAIQAMQATLQQMFPGCRSILLIPESHSRNVFYYQSFAVLRDILLKAGYEVRLGSLIHGLREAQTVTLQNGETLLLEPITREGNRLKVSNFDPCLVLLNNDLSEGVPDLLTGLEQRVMPALSLGWANRWKSKHFSHYEKIAVEFAAHLDLDPWLITPSFKMQDNIDFIERQGEESLMQAVTDILDSIKPKYQQYGVAQDPFVVVKADSGTYGMGVLMVQKPEEIAAMNRKQRQSMAITKGNRKISQVIVQEGVYTNETIGEEKMVAEPVIYLIGSYVAGGFYRIHTEKGPKENLNSPGMHFQPLAFAKPCNYPCPELPFDETVNRFYTYGVVARLALLAAAHELAEVNT